MRAEFFGDKIVWHFFLDDNLNREVYLELLENNVDPMTNIIENGDVYSADRLFCHRTALNLLDNI